MLTDAEMNRVEDIKARFNQPRIIQYIPESHMKDLNIRIGLTINSESLIYSVTESNQIV